ncbi:MAG TPA: type II toxin-antitoxin system HicA family toxin [Candidatus Nanoarchaeia archaeon]|nr:type II toxin-antitoxin system HicA family toxin [Candidatus Nanoarchaeia archaeon]
MPKLPIVSGEKILKVLLKKGFHHIRTRGSHAILTKQTPEGKVTLPVPLHRELARGTLKSIMNQANIELEELLRLL